MVITVCNTDRDISTLLCIVVVLQKTSGNRELKMANIVNKSLQIDLEYENLGFWTWLDIMGLSYMAP